MVTEGEIQEEMNTSEIEIKKKPICTNGVIITTYMESQIIQSHHKNDPIKRINMPIPFCSSKPPLKATTSVRSCGYDRRGSCGYDRRGQLLAYAQELRHANSHHREGFPKMNSKPANKKWRWSPSSTKLPLSFRELFHPTKRHWRYQHIRPTDEVDDSIRKTKTSTGRCYSHNFFRRLRCVLKELSCTWKCNKGSRY